MTSNEIQDQCVDLMSQLRFKQKSLRDNIVHREDAFQPHSDHKWQFEKADFMTRYDLGISQPSTEVIERVQPVLDALTENNPAFEGLEFGIISNGAMMYTNQGILALSNPLIGQLDRLAQNIHEQNNSVATDEIFNQLLSGLIAHELHHTTHQDVYDITSQIRKFVSSLDVESLHGTEKGAIAELLHESQKTIDLLEIDADMAASLSSSPDIVKDFLLQVIAESRNIGTEAKTYRQFLDEAKEKFPTQGNPLDSGLANTRTENSLEQRITVQLALSEQQDVNVNTCVDKASCNVDILALANDVDLYKEMRFGI